MQINLYFSREKTGIVSNNQIQSDRQVKAYF